MDPDIVTQAYRTYGRYIYIYLLLDGQRTTAGPVCTGRTARDPDIVTQVYCSYGRYIYYLLLDGQRTTAGPVCTGRTAGGPGPSTRLSGRGHHSCPQVLNRDVRGI